MNDNTHVVYMHRNKINNKVYIGISNDYKRRWRNNGIEYKPSKTENQNRPFWNAIEKYGWDGFTHEILIDGLTEKEAIEKEIELISRYKATDRERGYNISSGGNGGRIYKEHPRGMLGKPQTEHQIKSMKKLRENFNPMDTVIWGVTHEHPRGMKGKTHSEEFKKKVSEMFKGGSSPNTRKVKATQNGKEILFDCIGECIDYFKTNTSIVYKLLKSGELYELKPSNTRKEQTKHLVGLKLEYVNNNANSYPIVEDGMQLAFAI